MLVKWVFYKFN